MSLPNRPVYLARLTTVIEKFFGLEPADTTSLWRELLREHSVQYWVTAIDLCTIYLQSPCRRCLSTNARVITTARISADKQTWCLPFCNTLLDTKTPYICLHWLGHESERRHANESQSAQKLPSARKQRKCISS